MDSSYKTQMDIKNSVEDLQGFLNEMKHWENEIKAKEAKLKGIQSSAKLPEPRNQKKRVQDEKRAENNKAYDRFDSDEASAGKGNKLSSSDEDIQLPPQKRPDKRALNDRQSSSVEEGRLQTDKNRDVLRKVAGASKEIESKVKSVEIPSNSGTVKKPDKLQNIDAAFFEKELGNKFVKEGKWQEAIQCYSRAIDFDSKNPVFFANRSLCYLKIANFKVAEVDSTVAIQMDSSYVKAYQRRALARKAMGQYSEAKEDFTMVLKLEPNNKAAQLEIAKIDEYLEKSKISKFAPKIQPIFDPKKMFSVAKVKSEVLPNDRVKKITPPKSHRVLMDAPPKGSLPVVPVYQPPHLRSKVPLTQVQVTQVDSLSPFDRLVSHLRENEETALEHIKKAELTKSDEPLVSEEAKIKEIEPEKQVTFDNPEGGSHPDALLEIPKTFIQFETAWNQVRKDLRLCYLFLKTLPSNNLRSIFGSSLESYIISDLLSVLSQDEILQDSCMVYEILRGLTEVERFSSLILFASAYDRQAIRYCLDRIKCNKTQDAVDQLARLYDL